MAASIRMNQLMKKRDDIEAEIKTLSEVLDSQQDVGMDGPLVDTEGFPRADIDVYSVRHARHGIIYAMSGYFVNATKSEEFYSDLFDWHDLICHTKVKTFGTGLQNDHKAIMEEIEEELYKIHAEARKTRGEEDNVVNDVRVPPPGSERLAFGTVTKLDEGSPASTAGLMVDDKVIQFGSVTADNFQGLQNIATIVQHSIGKSIPVTVKRADKVLNLSIIPQRWHKDKGLLGCTIHPDKSKPSS